MIIPSNSPPKKRILRSRCDLSGIPVSGYSDPVSSSSPPLSDQAILATLSSPIRDAHLQFHDRLRDLKRDFQFMAGHYLKIRDERISASLSSRAPISSSTRVPSGPSIATSTLLEPDLDLDLSEYVTPSVAHE